MKFLASKEMSLFCFGINCVFMAGAWLNSDEVWFLISAGLAALCFWNYQTALEGGKDD